MAFLDHLNSIHKDINSTGRQQWVPCKVYKKFIHTNLELNLPTTPPPLQKKRERRRRRRRRRNKERRKKEEEEEEEEEEEDMLSYP